MGERAAVLAVAAGGAEPPDEPPYRGLDLSNPAIAACVRTAVTQGFITFRQLHFYLPPYGVLIKPVEAIAEFLVDNNIALIDD